MTDADHSARIAALNDQFRRTATRGVVISATLAALDPGTIAALVARVRSFSAFTPDNDPYGERDFGSFTHRIGIGGPPRDETILWKIDVYADHSLTYGAEDAAHPDAVRILTIMHARDY